VALAPGARLGSYDLVALVATGGMGEVWKARDVRLGRTVALKILPAHLHGPRAHRTFEREARSVATLSHPNIVMLYSIETIDHVHFMTMEWVEGRTLGEVMARETIPLDRMLQIGIDIADALGSAHERGIVHRDLKPANVIVTAEGRVKVLDFGLAHIEKLAVFAAKTGEIPAPSSEEGRLEGTVSYMSPEQATGRRVDHRSDIFSLGAILYELCTGEPPFKRKTTPMELSAVVRDVPRPVTEANPRIPVSLARIVGRCLAKDPGQRYQNAADLRNDLAELRPEITVGDPDGRRLRTRRVLVGALLMAVAGSVLFGLWGAREWLFPRRTGVRPEAMQAFLQATSHAAIDNPADAEKAVQFLERAVILDPAFARGWGRLALAYAQAISFNPEREVELTRLGTAAAQQALRLDPKTVEAYLAQGWLLWTRRNRFPHREALKQFARALAVDPDSAIAHGDAAGIYSHVGMFDEAIAHATRAIQIDPLAFRARLQLAFALLWGAQAARALAEFRRLPRDFYPSVAGSHHVWALLAVGRRGEAEATLNDLLLEREADLTGELTGIRAYLAADDGRTADAERLIQEALSRTRYGHFHHTAYFAAWTYARLNRPDPAIRWFREAALPGWPCFPLFERDPHLDPLRTDARFQDALADVRREWERLQRELKGMIPIPEVSDTGSPDSGPGPR
jgi:tetratricopeptide (TPR) repeat protein